MARTVLGPEYRKLWVASAVSNLGDGITLVAGPLLAATLTRDPVLVAGITFAQRLPWLLFSLLSGALVDRLDRRLTMGTVDLLRFVLLGVLGLAVLAGWATLPLLYAVFFLVGAAETFFANASLAIMPSIVPKEHLDRANGRLFAAELVTNQFAGGPIGGALFAVAAALPFLLDAGTFGVSAVLILALRGSFRVSEPGTPRKTGMLAEIGEGIGWLLCHRLLLALAIMLGAGNLVFSATSPCWCSSPKTSSTSVASGTGSCSRPGGSVASSAPCSPVGSAPGWGRDARSSSSCSFRDRRSPSSP